MQHNSMHTVHSTPTHSKPALVSHTCETTHTPDVSNMLRVHLLRVQLVFQQTHHTNQPTPRRCLYAADQCAPATARQLLYMQTSNFQTLTSKDDQVAV
jgi:hypothetical protein